MRKDINLSKELHDKINIHHERIVEEYCYQNKTTKEIAESIGVNTEALSRYRSTYNIERLYKDKEWLEDKFNKGISSIKIAKSINCSPSNVDRALHKFGLREKGDYAKRDLVVNEKYFSTYNSKSCYWAGFINADGHISCDIPYGKNTPNYKLRIMLSFKDKAHLCKLNKELTRQDLIKDNTTKLKEKNHKMSILSLSRKSICEDLINSFGVIPKNKSLKETYSSNIPSDYLRDYLRGYFDGDGSISVSKKGGTFVTVVGSYEICKLFKDTIDAEYNKDIGTISESDKSSGLFLYRISNQKDAVLLFLYMYYKDCVHLERKKDKFKQVLYKI